MSAVIAPAIDLGRDIVMGHEFCAEVIEAGPDAGGPASGTPVVSVPILLTESGLHQLAYNNDYPAGFAEHFLLSAPLVLPVPNGLEPRIAALTEPLAVGIHAVAAGAVTPRHAAAVAGCGPVGLAVIAGLRLEGVEVIVASDYSPARRALALQMGATEVVDPREEPLLEAWRRVDGSRQLVCFEAIGIPGVMDSLLRDVPVATTIVVVGVCMEPDTTRPFFGSAKEICIKYVFAYTPEEFARALRALSEGDTNVAPMITGSVDLDGVPGAFEALGTPDNHVKILVEPSGA
jgi:threonine dehydrogenase-like Zn-dependent dehydrogenase